MSFFTLENLQRAKELVLLYPEKRSALIPLCHLAQAQHGHLSSEAMEEIAKLLDIEPAEVLGTVSFYDMLHTEEVGKFLIGICTNVACLLQGSVEILEHACDVLGIVPGSTSEDGLFTLEETECVAHCDKAPCAQVNYRFFGPLDFEGFDQLVTNLREGTLDSTVPPHGVLSRVPRSAPSLVPQEVIREERSRMDREKETRLAALKKEGAEKQ